MSKHRTTALGLTAGLIGGSAAGLLIGVPALTSASGDGVAVVEQDDGTDTTTPSTDTSDDRSVERGHRIRDELQDLVDDETITAEQADAVASHLAEQLPARRGGHGPGRFGGHERGGRWFDGDVVAGVLGMTAAEVRDALRDGSSIADLAEQQGVDVQDVVDALVTEVEEHLDVAVENGRLTQDEADEKLADVTERITDMVEEAPPFAD